MPRKPRLHYPGALYHVIVRGNNRQTVFSSPEEYKTFLNYLRQNKVKQQFLLYAYCLMPNHIHLLIEVKTIPLSSIMQRLLTAYTLFHNRKHKRHGHLFQGRYKAILCDKDSYLLELVRYIHLNPVRAKLVKAPGEWPWSGHKELGGHVEETHIDEEPVLQLFSRNKHDARSEYRAFVRDGMVMGHRHDMYPVEKTPYLGDEEYVHDQMSRHEEAIAAANPEKRKPEVSLTQLLNELSKRTGVKPETIQGKSRKREASEARSILILAAYKAGQTPANIARFIERCPSFVSRVIDKNSNKSR